MSPAYRVGRNALSGSVLGPSSLHPSFTKARCPFSGLARFEGDKVGYVQFLDDSYGTAGSFKTGGITRFHSDRSGKEVEV